MNINSSHWAIEGWTCNGNAAARGFQVDSCLTTTTQIHHVAFINDVSYNNNQGYDIADECGYGSGVPPAANSNGGDYMAVVGSIAQNAALDGGCLAAVDAVGNSPFDSVSGTHIFVHGNFVWSSASTPCLNVSDAEAMMIDTPDAHGFNNKYVFSNNMVWNSQRFCWQTFPQTHSTTFSAFFYNNTCYNNLTNVGSNAGTDSSDGEINIANAGNSSAWSVTVQNNIAQNTNATSGSLSRPIYAYVGGPNPQVTLTFGGAGNQNIFSGAAGTCPGGATCDSGNNIAQFNGGLGTNTYSSPSFTSVTDLNANWQGAPNCTGFENVTRCMGYNATTSTLTSLTPISDLHSTFTSTGASGKGYQTPTTTCIASYPDYPTYLSSIVYLHWTGSIIQRKLGLVAVPCGL